MKIFGLPACSARVERWIKRFKSSILSTQATAQVAPYGTWHSPISSTSAVAEAVVISYVFVDPITHQVYHIEQRPTECGRSVIVHSRSSVELFQPGSHWNARSGVHEYGGGAAAAYDNILYFSHVDDGRLYTFSVSVRGHDHVDVHAETPTPVTPINDRKRYASPTPHPTQHHLLVAVLEDHTHDASSMVVNSLVCIDTLTSSVHPLVEGADFYAAPTFSPDGTRLAWQAWNHPHMPWEGTSIWVADIALSFPTSTGSPMQATDHVRIAGSVPPQPIHPGSGVSYVSWLDDDALLFLAEASGWRNPWVYRLSSRNATPVLKAPLQEDFASVYKFLGASYYAPLIFSGLGHGGSSQSDESAREMLFVAYRSGRSILYVVDLVHRGRADAIELECPFVDVSCVQAVGHPTERDSAQVVFVASSSNAPSMVTFCTISRQRTGYKASFCPAKALAEEFSTCLSLPQPMTLTDGDDGPLHIVYYAPANSAYLAPPGERPPCVVNVHGGPTLVALQGLDWTKQWYTSRGWAWLDVNYRGSSLYGRKYTDRLDGRWGVLDVLDCVRAAHVLSHPPYSLVDSARCVIRGLSAGGYTVLSYAAGTYRTADAPSKPSAIRADAAFSFKAGASHFGIADLPSLAQASHKFESHYIFKLVGGRPDEPEMRDVYQHRSPVLHADRIVMPLLMLQGLADRVVPPVQSQAMVDAIVAHGGSSRVKYKTYADEGHGFSRAETLRSGLEEEATWFARWLGIKIRL